MLSAEVDPGFSFEMISSVLKGGIFKCPLKLSINWIEEYPLLSMIPPDQLQELLVFLATHKSWGASTYSWMVNVLMKEGEEDLGGIFLSRRIGLVLSSYIICREQLQKCFGVNSIFEDAMT